MAKTVRVLLPNFQMTQSFCRLLNRRFTFFVSNIIVKGVIDTYCGIVMLIKSLYTQKKIYVLSVILKSWEVTLKSKYGQIKTIKGGVTIKCKTKQRGLAKKKKKTLLSFYWNIQEQTMKICTARSRKCGVM